MKKLLLILPVLILAGAAAWWFLLRAPAAEEVAPTPEALAVKFIELKPISVPIIRDGAAEKVARIAVAIELLAANSAPKVKETLPRLTDAFVVELYALLARRQMEVERYDADIIKRRLQRASDRVLGPGVVAAVLVRGLAVASAQ